MYHKHRSPKIMLQNRDFWLVRCFAPMDNHKSGAPSDLSGAQGDLNQDLAVSTTRWHDLEEIPGFWSVLSIKHREWINNTGNCQMIVDS